MSEEEHNQKPAPIRKGFWKDLLSYLVTALVVVVPIRMFIAQPFVVNGASMDTTFENGEYLIIDELSYRFEEPKRGDVIVFRYPLEPKKYFIKRIIGLPGETVAIKNRATTVINKDYPEGITLLEPYAHTETLGTLQTTLDEGEYFVMGDNRLVSSDSRSWGTLPRKNIIGRPIIRLFPFERIGYRPGAVHFDETLIE